MERAQAHREKGDLAASIIELKNAVQADRTNATVRLLLGQTYLRAGQLDSAEKEFLRARDLGLEPKTAVEMIATVWLMLDKAEHIIGEFQPDEELPRDLRVSIHLARAIAYYHLGDLEKSDVEFREAREADPENLVAAIGISSVALERGDLPEAEASLDFAGSRASDDLSVLALTGDLKFRQGDLEAAAAAYQGMLEQKPDGIGSRLALAQVQLAQGKLDEAKQNIEQVLSRFPKHTGANYLRAAIAMKQGDIAAAKIHSERVLHINPQHGPSLLIAGATALDLARLEQAYRYLSAFVAKVPDHELGERLLAQASARLERQERFPARLTQLLDGTADDRLLLTIEDPDLAWRGLLGVAGQLWSELQEATDAEAPFDPCPDETDGPEPTAAFPDASAPLPWLPGVADQTCLDVARDSLARALKRKRYAFVPGVLSAQLKVRDREFDEAIHRVEGLRLDDQERPDLLLLQGLAELGRGRSSKARDMFRQVVAAAPKSAAARYLLAMTYQAPDDWDRRRAELEAAEDLEPGFLEASLALVRQRALEGELQEAGARARHLASRNPRHAGLQELDGTLALLRDAPDAAAETLKNTLEIELTAIRALKLALAHERAGAAAEGREVLEGWLRSHPGDTQVRLALANRYLSAGELEAARSHYRKAVLAVPYNFVALNNLAWIELSLGRASLALDLAARAHELAPNDARVLDTYGFALMENGELGRAVEALRRAVTRDPGNAGSRYRLARALSESGAREEAKSVLQDVLAQQAEFPERMEAERLLDTL